MAQRVGHQRREANSSGVILRPDWGLIAPRSAPTWQARLAGWRNRVLAEQEALRPS